MVAGHALKNLFILTVVSGVCLTSLQATAIEKATTAPKKTIPIPAPVVPKLQVPEKAPTPTPIPIQPELNATIEKIFLKGNKIFVLLTGSGRIIPEDYSKIILRIETSRGPRQWSLAEADKTRLLGTGRNKVEFDTGILLEKPEMVKGILVYGKIEKPKQEMLTVAAIASPKASPAAGKPMTIAAAPAVRPRSTPPSPTLMLYDIGIRITPPLSSASYYQGEPITARYEWTHSSAPTGNIEFGLENLDMTENFAPVTIPAARSGSITINPPATLRPQRYSVVGFNRDTGAFGRSDVFEVNRNSARIDFLSPAAGAVFHPGDTMTVRYRLNRRVEPGNIAFLFGSEGRVTTINRPYTPPPATSDPLPEYSFSFTIPSATPIGRYGIFAMHSTASGVGPAVSVEREPIRDGGSDGTAFTDCDYGIESVTFTNGRNLDTGISANNTESHITGRFHVGIRWNGIRIPPEFPPGTIFQYEIRLHSALTGERIATFDGGVFDYTTQDSFGVDMSFEIYKTDIPRLRRDRFIPLEFRLARIGPSIDANPFNNTLSANMRILDAVENNMELDLNPADFHLTRRPSAAPTDEYTLTQRFRVRNLSRSEVGGAPAPINVSVRGCIYRRDGAESWDHAAAYDCRTMTINNVASDWISRDCELSWRMASPWEIPNDTRFRVELKVDPEHVLIDPDQNNNSDQYTFRVTGDPPGAGSGTVR